MDENHAQSGLLVYLARQMRWRLVIIWREDGMDALERMQPKARSV